MAGSATFTMVVSRLTRNAASSSATRITGFDRMAQKLRQLVVNGGLKPPGVNRDARRSNRPGRPPRQLTGNPQREIPGCFGGRNQPGVWVGEVASHH